MTLTDRIAKLKVFCDYEVEEFAATVSDSRLLGLAARALELWPRDFENPPSFRLAELILDVMDFCTAGRGGTEAGVPNALFLKGEPPSPADRKQQEEDAQRDQRANGDAIPNSTSAAADRLRQRQREINPPGGLTRTP